MELDEERRRGESSDYSVGNRKRLGRCMPGSGSCDASRSLIKQHFHKTQPSSHPPHFVLLRKSRTEKLETRSLIIPITDPPFLLSLLTSMCVGFWSLTHPDYALILCANRDEYLARPTLPAHFHSFEALTAPAPSNDAVPVVQDDSKSKVKVLSGRDVRAEGTWLGISQSTGRVALL